MLVCDFCSVAITNSDFLQGNIGNVCFRCVEILYEIKNSKALTRDIAVNKFQYPKQIFDALSEKVVGQDYAKRVLAVAAYNHYLSATNPGIKIKKSNILMIGGTGTGKTYLAETLAEILNVPIVFEDITTVTEAGYVGRKVQDLVLNLYKKAGRDVAKTEKGIIFIDEIDKIAGSNHVGNKDISGFGVQKGLLKLIEGTTISTTSRDRMEVDINTSNILFICAGSFAALEKEQMRQQQTKIGFSQDSELKSADELRRLLNFDKLVEFGMMPELLGRLPIYAPLKDLTEADLIKIIKEPRGSVVEQMSALFKLSGKTLKISDNVLVEIAKRSIEKKTGARAIRALMEKLLLDEFYQISSLKEEDITVDEVPETLFDNL